MVIFENLFFIRFYLFFRERGREGERGQKHQCVVTSHVPPTGDLAHSPGMRPDRESNQRPFGLQAHAQSIEPHPPRFPSTSHSRPPEVVSCFRAVEVSPPHSLTSSGERPLLPSEQWAI